MIRSLSIFVCLAFAACQTRVFDNGKPALLIGSNLQGTMTYKTATCKFTFNGTMNNSTPTHAVGKIIATIGSDVVAALVPGTGVVPTVGRAATVVVPHLSPTP